MLKKIFLLKSRNPQNLNNLDIFSYPEDLAKNEDNSFIQKIIAGHEECEILDKAVKNDTQINKTVLLSKKTNNFIISPPVHQIIENDNIYTMCINSTMLIGLIFDQEDNPFDYKEIFEDLSSEFLNAEKSCFFEDEIEIENLLITLFIDIRRYGDEILGKYPKILVPPTGIATKIFLFGIDNVGKSSFVRRVKTGEYNDNYFPPTRKFNIEYIQKPNGIFSIWDMAGQSIFREKWLKGIQYSNFIIYMIDVANQIRFEEAKKEFWSIFNQYNFSETPLLILGNKVDLIQDTKNLNDSELQIIKNQIIDSFDFEKLTNINWKFILASVKTNYNINSVLNLVYNYA